MWKKLSLSTLLFPLVLIVSTVADLSKEDLLMAERQREEGRILYRTNCASCHAVSGGGMRGSFPSIRGSKVVQDTEELMRHICGAAALRKDNAGSGRLQCPPYVDLLSSNDLAMLAQYIRAEWGDEKISYPLGGARKVLSLAWKAQALADEKKKKKKATGTKPSSEKK